MGKEFSSVLTTIIGAALAIQLAYEIGMAIPPSKKKERSR